MNQRSVAESEAFMTSAFKFLENPAIHHSVRQISVEEYHRLGEAAIIPEGTELLHGIILNQMIKSPLHTWTVRILADWLREAMLPNHDVRQEQPITLLDSEPEPDLAIVKGTPADYRASHPSTAEVVMEIAISTIELDREKASVYAEAGVQEYWIVLPRQRVIEIFTRPSQAGYESGITLAPPTIVALNRFPNVTIDLAELFADTNDDQD